MNANRNLKLDGLKFVMIFLVVLGHLTYNDYGIGFNRIIYSFHMPVFVFLSGYFTSQNTNKKRQIRWLWQTLFIYIIAQFAHFILEFVICYAQAVLNHETFDATSLLSLKNLISPRLALWYLVCLMYWRMSIWFIFQNTSDLKLLGFSCAFALASGLIPIDHEFAFQRAFSFFPFFVIGMIIRKREFMPKLYRVPYIEALIILLIGLVIARYLPTYMPKFHYSNWHQPILRVFQSCLGLVLCLCILRIAKIDLIEKFARYGVYTLWIYIGHTYIIILCQKSFAFWGITLDIVTAFTLACFICIFFVYMAKIYHSQIDEK